MKYVFLIIIIVSVAALKILQLLQRAKLLNGVILDGLLLGPYCEALERKKWRERGQGQPWSLDNSLKIILDSGGTSSRKRPCK